MREILFRGKRVDNGEWIYGYYFYDDFYQKGYITFGRYTQILKPITNFSDRSLQVYAFEVNPETVGQYTGLTDKNGKKIFEGDIVVINTSEKRKIKKYRVEFDNSIFGIRLSTNANDNTIIPLRSFDYIEIIKGEEND